MCTELQCLFRALLITQEVGRMSADRGTCSLRTTATYYLAVLLSVDQVVFPVDALDFEVDSANLGGQVVGRRPEFGYG